MVTKHDGTVETATSGGTTTESPASTNGVALPGRRRDRGRQSGNPGFAWALPGLLFFLIFAVGPLLVAVWLSFTEYNGIRLSPPEWVGLANWAKIFTDAALHRSLVTTVVLIVLAVVTQVPVSLLIGVWAAGPQRGRAAVVALYFIPLLMSTAAIAVLFASLVDPNFGLPSVLDPILGPNHAFSNLLGDRWTAIGVIAFVYLWGASPLHTLIYQGGARAIPPVLYQAAAVDGASGFQQFWHITLPQLKNTFMTSTIIMVVGTFTSFDIILLLTRGGPSGGTSNLPYFMYDRGIAALDFGYGSVIAVVLIIIATLTSIVMVRVSGYHKMDNVREGIG